jgi:hypothetical protein
MTRGNPNESEIIRSPTSDLAAQAFQPGVSFQVAP